MENLILQIFYYHLFICFSIVLYLHFSFFFSFSLLSVKRIVFQNKMKGQKLNEKAKVVMLFLKRQE